MQNEIANMRREKENLVIEKNESKLHLMKELDQNKFKIKQITSELEKSSQTLKNVEYESQKFKDRFDERNEEIKELTNEKYHLIRELREKDLDFQSFNVEIHSLRRKMEERDKEIQDNMNETNEKEKQRFIEAKNEKEDLQRKIDELNINYKDLQAEYKTYFDKTDKELHVAKRDYYIIQEEKRMLIKRITEVQQDLDFIREDYEKKSKANEYYEQELESLQEKYRDLSNKESENYRIRVNLENTLKSKAEEIDNQTKAFTMLKKTSGYEELRDEYEHKLNQVIQRKDYYKNKVYLCVIINYFIR